MPILNQVPGIICTRCNCRFIEASDLAGYRNGPVYIKGSRHTPSGLAAIRDAMPALFEILKDEKEPSVRAVPGHFFFVYLTERTVLNTHILYILVQGSNPLSSIICLHIEINWL
jgi:hypothetical protein